MGVVRVPEFDRWFMSFYPVAVRLAARIVGDRGRAEELAAEAFTRALSRWSRLTGADYRDAWLLRVVTNLAIDEVRRRPRPMPPQVGHDAGDDLADRMVVLAGLRRLPQRQRQAVVLRYFGQFSVAEVASVLGVSVGTARTHLRRGLTHLRADPGLLGEANE